MTSHTRPWKEGQLAELKGFAKKYPVVAIADINMFPSNLFQVIRKRLHSNSAIRVTKARVLRKSLEESEKAKELAGYAKENCAVIYTELNPFELFAFLKKNKGKVAASAGAIAIEDISVPAGDTGLPPGPALSDLKGAGLKVAVQGSTIAILQDKVVTKAGEAISPAVAGTLSKLNIKPFKVGMKLVACIEDGQVYHADVLDIDSDMVFANFANAHRNAFNLAFNSRIFTTETTELLLAKAFNDSKAVAMEANIMTSATVGDLLAKANAQAGALKGMVKDAPKAAEEKKEPAESAQEEGKGGDSGKAEDTKGDA
ncbi:MAG: 50S ribosomal protein L10 [archaeon]|nr:50S ribosomal protein L10 [archaeon]